MRDRPVVYIASFVKLWLLDYKSDVCLMYVSFIACQSILIYQYLI